MDTKIHCPETQMEAIQFFANPDNCHNFMVAMRWPSGVTCPRCGSDKIGKLVMPRRVWNCKNKECPNKQFTAKVGTIFEDSPLGLDKWLTAVWLIVNAKNGISSHELHRAIGVTQKTTWFMLHRIRVAMQEGSIEKMKGRVEADETWIGAKARNLHKDKKFGTGRGYNFRQVAVLGLLERNTGEEACSKIRLKAVRGTRSRDLAPEVRLENFWSLLKRGIRGTYVSVEPFHLFRYLDEQSYRFNQRKDDDGGRFRKALTTVANRRLTYRQLTGKAVA